MVGLCLPLKDTIINYVHLSDLFIFAFCRSFVFQNARETNLYFFIYFKFLVKFYIQFVLTQEQYHHYKLQQVCLYKKRVSYLSRLFQKLME